MQTVKHTELNHSDHSSNLMSIYTHNSPLQTSCCGTGTSSKNCTLYKVKSTFSCIIIRLEDELQKSIEFLFSQWNVYTDVNDSAHTRLMQNKFQIRSWHYDELYIRRKKRSREIRAALWNLIKCKRQCRIAGYEFKLNLHKLRKMSR